jgi:nitrite reductase/ring-hydroxylating ferredoxin subunit
MADVRDCEGCPLVPRRDFLRDAALALVGRGLLPAAASAMPVEFVSSLGGTRADKVYAIPAKDGTQIDKDEETMITRWQGKLFVFALTCPHQNTALKWYEKDNQFECPKHHSRFSPDGVYIKDSGRATRGLDRFAVRRDGNNVHVNLDKLYQEDDNEAEWKAAFITL